MTPSRCTARMPCSPVLQMSNGNKASKRGEGPHISDVCCMCLARYMSEICRDSGGSSQSPDSIYEMSIISSRCSQKIYVGRSHIRSGNKVRFSCLLVGMNLALES